MIYWNFIKRNKKPLAKLTFIVFIIISMLTSLVSCIHKKFVASKKSNTPKETVINITGSGDMLYHDIVYGSAWNGERYDFDNDYEYVKPLISSVDLALGDFEGTINPNMELSGYPIFNAPEAVVGSIKDTGFDVIDLGHNHIMDTGLEGLIYTHDAFENVGISTIGVNTSKEDPILVKNVKGIKVAILAYSYGYNGLDVNLSKKEHDYYLKQLDMDKVQKDIGKAEKIADITVIMPQSGVEYNLQPTEEQKKNYRQMVDWGADVIFGGHPHVAEPTETINKDGQKKFIIYSMGNLLSNQRYETLENSWTERGVIMQVEITKKGKTTKITNVKAHPTWVSREEIPGRTFIGYPAYDYQVLLAEDYIKGGKYAGTRPADQDRITSAYYEIMDLLNIKW